MPRPLLDIAQKKKDAKFLRRHILAAEIVLKYGGWKYPNHTPFTDDHIRECWNDPTAPMPTSYWLRKYIKVLAVKDYIRRYFDLNDPIWNADFIHGLFKHGKVLWVDSPCKHRFPAFHWDPTHFSLTQLVQLFPYGGFKSIGEGKLKGVPALCVKHQEDTIAFISGVLSAGRIVELNQTSFAVYWGNTIPYIKKWGIPIEIDFTETGEIAISPFWPALFTPHMPEIAAKKWMDIDNPCKAEAYSAIMWRIYCNRDFPTRAIPYLPSARTIYSRFKTDDLTTAKNLERMRVTHGLTGLDNRFRDMVKEWKERYEKEQGKRIAL